MLEGSLAVRDLPKPGTNATELTLVCPSSDSDGVLQDVHWYGGMIGGMFQGTLATA